MSNIKTHMSIMYGKMKFGKIKAPHEEKVGNELRPVVCYSTLLGKKFVLNTNLDIQTFTCIRSNNYEK
jgi:hypothetical protein